MGGYVNLSDIEDRLKLYYIFTKNKTLLKSKDSKKKGQIKKLSILTLSILFRFK